MQRFYELPFVVDIHFGYKDSAWTAAEMNMDTTKTNIDNAREAYDDKF